MAQQFANLQQLLRAGVDDKDGNLTKEFIQWAQGVESKLEAFDLRRQLAPTVAIQGRTEGLGTTLQNVDESGVVTEQGVDLSRDYVNKSLEHVPDSNLRRALTPEQTNYIAVASVQSAGQSAIARPTTYFDLGDPETLANPQNAYDSDPATFAAIEGFTVVTGTDFRPVVARSRGDLSLRGFVQPGSALAVAVLRIRSLFNTAEATGTVRYSLNGGLTWTNLYQQAFNRVVTTDEIPLLVGQDFSKIWVEAIVSPTATDGDEGVIWFYDARVDYTLA